MQEASTHLPTSILSAPGSVNFGFVGILVAGAPGFVASDVGVGAVGGVVAGAVAGAGAGALLGVVAGAGAGAMLGV